MENKSVRRMWYVCKVECFFFEMRGKLFYYLFMGLFGIKGILFFNKVYLVGEKVIIINIFVNSF